MDEMEGGQGQGRTLSGLNLGYLRLLVQIKIAPLMTIHKQRRRMWDWDRQRMDGWVDGVWGAALLKMRLAILMLLFAPTYYVQARSAFEWGLVVAAVLS